MAQDPDRVHWYRKKRWWALIAAPFALFFLVFVAFDPIVEWVTRRALSKVEGYSITYGNAKLQPTKLNDAITELRIVKGSAGGKKQPLLFVGRAELGLHWKELLHGNLVAKVNVDGVVRNAFVAGVTESFERLPPPKADEKEGVLKQAADALDKDHGLPEAQPDTEEQKPKEKR